MTQPQLLPIRSDSGCICQGSPAIKPSPCCRIPPKHTPVRPTGLGYLQDFFRNYSSKVLHWKMLQNLDEKHEGAWWIFPIAICPPSCTVLCSTLTPLHIPPLYPHSFSPMLFPFTSLGYLLHNGGNLLCLQQTGRTQLYLVRSNSHTTGFSVSTPQQQMHKQDAGICEIYKNIEGHKWARSKCNSSRMSMFFLKISCWFQTRS